jgi:transaldolase
MKKLSESNDTVERKLIAAQAKTDGLARLELDEKKFRHLLNEDAMATEKTAEGIRKFAADISKLEKFVAGRIRQ